MHRTSWRNLLGRPVKSSSIFDYSEILRNLPLHFWSTSGCSYLSKCIFPRGKRDRMFQWTIQCKSYGGRWRVLIRIIQIDEDKSSRLSLVILMCLTLWIAVKVVASTSNLLCFLNKRTRIWLLQFKINGHGMEIANLTSPLPKHSVHFFSLMLLLDNRIAEPEGFPTTLDILWLAFAKAFSQ